MAEYTYFIEETSVAIELIIVGATPITGQTPYYLIKDSVNGTYFDFNDRTFKGAAWTSATALLTSAKDGLYTNVWDVSGLFTTNTHITVEFHNSGEIAIDNILFQRPPLSTANVAVYGGAGNVTVKGGFTKQQKDKLFSILSGIASNVEKLLANEDTESFTLIRDKLETVAQDINTISITQQMDKVERDVIRELDRNLQS